MAFGNADEGYGGASGEGDGPGLTLDDQVALAKAPMRRGWRDIAGKIWNAPNTAIGLAYGGLGDVVGEAGHALGVWEQKPAIRWRDNAVQFVHNPFGGVGAITIGNTTTYNGDPYDPHDSTWYPKNLFPGGVDIDAIENGHSIGHHEQAHTWQGEQLGPLYLPSNVLGGLNALMHGEDWHGAHNWNEVGPKANPPRRWQ